MINIGIRFFIILIVACFVSCRTTVKSHKKAYILIGPPASGKGFISKKLIEDYGYTHLSMGDLLRKYASKKDLARMAKGEMLEPSTIALILESAIRKNLNNSNGFVFDGVARKPEQVDILDKLMKKYDIELLKVIIIDKCNINFLHKRLKKRQKMEKRADDNLKTFDKRFNLYNSGINAILKKYSEIANGKMIKVNCNSDSIYKELKRKI